MARFTEMVHDVRSSCLGILFKCKSVSSFVRLCDTIYEGAALGGVRDRNDVFDLQVIPRILNTQILSWEGGTTAWPVPCNNPLARTADSVFKQVTVHVANVHGVCMVARTVQAC